jgi:hypothetical protein
MITFAAKFDFNEKKWEGKMKMPCGTKITIKRDSLSEFEEILFGYKESVKRGSKLITEFRRPKKEEFGLVVGGGK